VHKGKIYVIGGVDQEEVALRSIECYDPNAAVPKWELLDALLPDPTGRGHAGCASINGKIYIAGGYLDRLIASSGWEFHLETSTFTPIAHLPYPLDRFGYVGS
jgi:hypothetical protein